MRPAIEKRTLAASSRLSTPMAQRFEAACQLLAEEQQALMCVINALADAKAVAC